MLCASHHCKDFGGAGVAGTMVVLAGAIVDVVICVMMFNKLGLQLRSEKGFRHQQKKQTLISVCLHLSSAKFPLTCSGIPQKPKYQEGLSSLYLMRLGKNIS